MLKQLGSNRNTLGKLALCVWVMLEAACARYPDDPGWIAGELVYAFVDADVKKSQAITVPEQWDRIEEWMEGREPFNCRGGEWDTTGTGSSCYPAADDEMDCGLVYQCASERTPFAFK
ncbi:MAG: hypothetical protein K8R89_07350 [Anaerolineae bacterium]|nr:hypothetical protein [Anaerolineae bacterium]